MGPAPHGYLGWAEWGGSPRLPLTRMRLPVGIDVAHHSVTTVTFDPRADMRVLEHHAESLGHAFVDYSDTIHPSGVILAGRIDNVGGHTLNYNAIATGTCFIGDYRTRVLTTAQIESYKWLIDHRIEVGILRPGSYPTYGHGQVPGNSTECPAINVLNRFGELRQPYTGGSEDLTPDESAALFEIRAYVRSMRDGAAAFGVPPLLTAATESYYQLTSNDDDHRPKPVRVLVKKLPGGEDAPPG